MGNYCQSHIIQNALIFSNCSNISQIVAICRDQIHMRLKVTIISENHLFTIVLKSISLNDIKDTFDFYYIS